MVYRPKIDHRRCFVLLPLRSPFLGYFEKIITPAAAEEGLTAIKADDIYGTRAVIKDIWDLIWTSKVVVAIVTDKNPNVNYELGICHTLGIPTILVTESAEDVPFDYRHRRYLPYQTREAGWEQKLREDLRNTIRAVLSEPQIEDELPWPYSTYELSALRASGLLIPSSDARSLVLRGVKAVSTAVAPSFGPCGTAVSVVVDPTGRQLPYRRGSRIAQYIRSDNPLEAQGVEQMARLSAEIVTEVGDLTKTGILLCAAMIESGSEALQRGCVPKHLTAGMDRAVDAAAAHVMTCAKSADPDALRSVARTAAASDEEISGVVTESLRVVGADGLVGITDSNGPGPTLETTEGLQWDCGFLSPEFVTDTQRDECVLDDPFILISERPIGVADELLPVLEQVARANRTVLCIGSDFDDFALQTLIVNKQRGTLRCAAVKAPGFGDRRKVLLEDIAIMTGGKAFLGGARPALNGVKLGDLGKAGKVIVTRRETFVIDGAGRPEEITARIASLRRQVESAGSDFDTAKLRERLAIVSGGLAVLRTGGLTEAEQLDNRYRLESALYSTQTANQNGYVVGGGVTLFHAKEPVERLVPTNASEEAGIAAVAQSLQRPLLTLIQNSALRNHAESITKIADDPNKRTGFNAESGEIEDLIRYGVLDSARALSHALQLALAHAKGVLTTGSWDPGDRVISSEPSPIRISNQPADLGAGR